MKVFFNHFFFNEQAFEVRYIFSLNFNTNTHLGALLSVRKKGNYNTCDRHLKKCAKVCNCALHRAAGYLLVLLAPDHASCTESRNTWICLPNTHSCTESRENLEISLPLTFICTESGATWISLFLSLLSVQRAGQPGYLSSSHS